MVTTAATEELDSETLTAARRLLDEAFGGDFADDDWEHGLGGIHALVRDDDGSLIGHGSVVERRIWVGGRELRAGYFEGVAVRGDRRRRGIAAAVMTALIAHTRERYDFGMLSATEEGMPFYRATGWELWTGPSSVRERDGTITPTPDDDGGLFVVHGPEPLDVTAEITCEWRSGDVW